MLSSKKAVIAKNIEKSIVRGELVNGVYASAEFNYGSNHFYINAKDSVIIKNGEVYNGSIVSNGRYSNISLGTCANLAVHQLIALCLLEGAYDRLVNEQDTVVNHKTISCSVNKAKVARDMYYEMVIDRMFDKTAPEPDVSLLMIDCDKDNSVDNLEVCTQAENIAHGAFIKTFGLYGVAISSKDVPALKKVLIDEDLVEMVMSYYIANKSVPCKSELVKVS